MKKTNGCKALKIILEDQFIKVKAAKIISFGSGHKVIFDKPIKVNNRSITGWYFLNIMAYDVRVGDIMRFEFVENGLYFEGVDLAKRKMEG
ncbi:hypothetical protein [uncultured Phascolarctobacterium sp.]|uniref:hypothetical protein n=1 Tax=uncultured Phascolarctobacterium sp. TaxID=512296 RepID=UPI002604AA10|nr:hypothetical protein [uncultured Phascolarctobacterium sp.]